MNEGGTCYLEEARLLDSKAQALDGVALPLSEYSPLWHRKEEKRSPSNSVTHQLCDLELVT